MFVIISILDIISVIVACVFVCCRPAPDSFVSSLPVDSGRADLLAAIRGFKKTKLSRASERKVKKKKKHEDTVNTAGKASGGGGDFMSDLNAKLLMRRKGISGGAGKAGGGNGSGGSSDADFGRRSQNPLDRVSKLIPPPPPKPAADHSSDLHDDDWLDS